MTEEEIYERTEAANPFIVEQSEIDKLVVDAAKFETLSNRPLVITDIDSTRVIYASALIDRYMGFSHKQYIQEGTAYIARYFGEGQQDWLTQVNQWRKDFHEECYAAADLAPSPYYTYDAEIRNPVTGFTHKLVVRSTCLALASGGHMLATTFFDVSAIKRSRKHFFHAKSSRVDETLVRDLDQNSLKKLNPALTESERALVQLLRVVSPDEAAKQMGLKPGTIQAKLKVLCRKTDSIGLHGLVQMCDALGWC
jgi:hypothetical protein